MPQESTSPKSKRTAALRPRANRHSIRQYDIAPPLLLLILTLIYFHRQLLGHRYLYWGDIGLYFLPMLQLLHHQAPAGRIPLWNPGILCGAPYVGNPQTWPLYPTGLLLAPLPPEEAISIGIAAHVWIAGLGFYYLLHRGMSLRAAPSLLGAIVFMFGGQLVSKEQFPNMLQAIAYVPWALFSLQRLIERRTLERSVVFGSVFGLQLLAAHAQITLLTIYLAGSYGFFLLGRRCLERYKVDRSKLLRNAGKPAVRLAGLLVIAGLMATALAAGQLLPICELYKFAWRHKLTFTDANRFYLPANQIFNFILPMLHGHPFFGDYTQRGNYWETCWYVGWVPALLVLVAVVTAAVVLLRRPISARLASHLPSGAGSAIFFWLVVLIFSVWIARGGAGHLYRLAFRFLPGFRNFHDPARCLLWACCSIAVLSAHGLHVLLTRVAANRFGRERGGWARRRRIAAALILGLVFVDLQSFGSTLYPLTAPAHLYTTRPNGTVALVESDPAIQSGQARILAPDTARVWQRFSAHRSFRQGVPGFNEMWRETLTPNLPMDQHAGGPPILEAFGYEPVDRDDAQTILGGITNAYLETATDPQRRSTAEIAGLYGVLYVATDRFDSPDPLFPGLKTVYREPTLAQLAEPPAVSKPATARPAPQPGWVYVSRDLHWLPRARLVTTFAVVPDQRTAIRQIVTYANGGLAPDPRRATLIAYNPILDDWPAPGMTSPPSPAVSSAPLFVRAASEHADRKRSRKRKRGGPSDWPPATPAPIAVVMAGDVALRDLGPDRVRIDVNTGAPGLLILADTMHPGWTASIDGSPTPILSANGFVRAIALRNSGRHVVVFNYRPASFAVGLYLTLIGWLVIFGFIAARQARSGASLSGVAGPLPSSKETAG